MKDCPMLANWVRFKRVSENEYLVVDLLYDKTYSADEYTVWFLRQLDGETDPYSIDESLTPEEVDLLLEPYFDDDLLRDKRFYSRYFLYLLVTLWQPKVTPAFRVVAAVANLFLLVSFMPMLILSVYLLLFRTEDIGVDFLVTGTIFGLITGMFLHEAGHMFACIAYGGRFFEMGVMLQYLVMPGAYVLINKDIIGSRMKRIQVNAAGVEMNLLLASVCLIIVSVSVPLSGFFIGAAVTNLFLAFLNLTFVNGIDGMNIMCELLGVGDLPERAKTILKSPRHRRRLMKDGVSGKLTVIMCIAIRITQIALPVLLILNIIEVIICLR